MMDIFSLLLPKYTIDKNKKVRLITLFSGYDSQKLGFNYLNIDLEHYRAIEFDKYAIQSLNEIHNTQFETKDITKVSVDELGIVDTENINYIMTYSFPCTDLSLAGKRAGMDRESGTRSGLLWEVERLLKETKEKPQILIMENVPQVLSAKGWREWNVFLENLGYSNYTQILNAKDYGIPQNRERCFMVSILGDYSYEFPKPFELKDRLKDFLEENVDEKYYLSEKMINGMINTKFNQYSLNKIIQDENGISDTIVSLFDHAPLSVIENNPKYVGTYQFGKSEAFMNGKDRFEPNKEIIDCILTSQKVGVVENNKINILGEYIKGGFSSAQVIDKNGIAPTFMEHHRNVMGVIDDKPKLNNLRIRKLTPCECFKLMGVKPSDYNKITCSNAQKYKQAGNSIVTTVLMAIYSQLFENCDYKYYIEELLKELRTNDYK